MRKSELFFNVLRLPVDFFMLLAAGITAYLLRTEILSYFRPALFEFNLPLLRYLYIVVFIALVFIGAFAASGLYLLRERRRLSDEFLKIVAGSSAGILVIIIYIFLRQELFNSRFLVLGGWFFAIVFVFIGRILIRLFQDVALRKYKIGQYRVLVIGSNGVAQKIKEALEAQSKKGLIFAGLLNEPDITRIKSIHSVEPIDEIIISESGFTNEDVGEVITFCHEKHVSFKLIPNFYQASLSNVDFDVFAGFPIIELKHTALEGWGRVIKRVVDIAGAMVGLLLLSPVFAIVALLIKWETEGPVFVRLLRVSGNRVFYLYKFRSMINNAEELKAHLALFNERKDGPLFKMKEDPRITGVGRIIRKYRVDELPQFWNILKGEMSLIGPRPHQPDEIAGYQNHHKKVLAIKAGATGLAQISGSSDLSFEREVAIDRFYIDNWSLWLDIKILIKTLFKAFSDRSAV